MWQWASQGLYMDWFSMRVHYLVLKHGRDLCHLGGNIWFIPAPQSSDPAFSGAAGVNIVLSSLRRVIAGTSLLCAKQLGINCRRI